MDWYELQDKLQVSQDVTYSSNLNLTVVSQAICLGVTEEKELWLNWNDVEKHIFMYGGTGFGKSSLGQIFVRDGLFNFKQIIMMTPHGQDFRKIMANLHVASKTPGMETLVTEVFNKLIVLDFSDQRFAYPINSILPKENIDFSEQIAELVEGIAKIFDMDKNTASQMPRTKTWLSSLAHLVGKAGGSLEQCFYLSLVLGEKEAQELIKSTDADRLVKIKLQSVKKMSPARVEELTSGASNRFFEFIAQDKLRLHLSQITGLLDFDKILAEGKSVLINLGGLNHDLQQLLGTLLVHELECAIIRRGNSVKDPSPVFLFLDEFARFASKRFAYVLSEQRKFKLNCILANQILSQLIDKEENKILLESVLGLCRIKFIFGGSLMSDYDILAKEEGYRSINLKKEKNRIISEKQRAYLDWVDVVSYTTSTSESTSNSCSSFSSRGEVDGRGDGESKSYETDGIDDFLGFKGELKGKNYSKDRSNSTNSSRGEGDSSSKTSTNMSSTTTTRTPITIHETFYETTSITYYNLEEQNFTISAHLKGQPPQHCTLSIDGHLVYFKVEHINDFTEESENYGDYKKFMGQLILSSGYAKPIAEAIKEAEELREKFNYGDKQTTNDPPTPGKTPPTSQPPVNPVPTPDPGVPNKKQQKFLNTLQQLHQHPPNTSKKGIGKKDRNS